MRIGWASPLHEQSAIGRFSLSICEELRRRGAMVEIIRTEIGAEEKLTALESTLTVYPPAEVTTNFLTSRYDLCVVNVARDAADYTRTLEIARGFQCITIFHLAAGDGRQAEAAIPGEAPVELSDWAWMTIPAALSAGAVVHDSQKLDPVRRCCAGPVKVIPFDLNAFLGGPTAGGDCVEKYVDDLLEVLDEALRRAPLRNAGWTIGATVAEMGLAWDDPFSFRLGQEMSALFEVTGGAEK